MGINKRMETEAVLMGVCVCACVCVRACVAKAADVSDSERKATMDEECWLLPE